MNMRAFQKPETVPIYVEVRDTDTDELVDPSEGVLLTLTDPNMNVIFSEIPMTKKETGIYIYYWQPSEDSPTGWYKTRGLAVDGMGAGERSTVVLGGFYLQ